MYPTGSMCVATSWLMPEFGGWRELFC